jgi:hypothetical protein
MILVPKVTCPQGSLSPLESKVEVAVEVAVTAVKISVVRW